MKCILNVNGVLCETEVRPEECLLETLRERLHITSVKRGCENGDCGACTVLIDGEAVTSCIYLTTKAEGKKIKTIEAFAKPGAEHPLLAKFVEYGAFQCGFCATGVSLSAIALLNREKHPSEERIREALYGNLCRCSGYVQIVEAVKAYIAEQELGERNG